VTTVTHEVELETDPTLPPGMFGWVWLRLDPFGGLAAIRAGVTAERTPAETGAYVDWLVTRVRRVLNPDGSEPDMWSVFRERDTGGTQVVAYVSRRELDLPPLR
jgi:hypothetical protein